MAELITKEDGKEIQRLFQSKLAREVRIVLFTSKRDCLYCGETRRLLEEVSAFSEKVTFDVVDADGRPAEAKEWGASFAPTTVILASNGARLHYAGMPAGRQLRCFVDDVVDASLGRAELDDATRETIERVTTPTLIQVFVTPTCLYSPLVVRSAHRFALENQAIRAYMVETLEFPQLARDYGVVGTPRTVINGKVAFDGAPSERSFAEKVLEASGGP
jgi:glutaredoxin-like protein